MVGHLLLKVDEESLNPESRTIVFCGNILLIVKVRLNPTNSAPVVGILELLPHKFDDVSSIFDEGTIDFLETGGAMGRGFRG